MAKVIGVWFKSNGSKVAWGEVEVNLKCAGGIDATQASRSKCRLSN